MAQYGLTGGVDVRGRYHGYWTSDQIRVSARCLQQNQVHSIGRRICGDLIQVKERGSLAGVPASFPEVYLYIRI